VSTAPAEAALPDEADRRISPPMIWVGAATLVVGLVAGFFVGRGTASSGPSSLADAITKTASGSLSRGDVAGALQKSGGFRAVLGTGGGGLAGRGGAGTGGAGGSAGGGGGGTGGGGGRGGGVAGTVSSISGNVVTITTNAGSVKVIITGATVYQKSVAAALTDVPTGERVTVRPDFSTPSTGNQVNAGTVIIQPATAATPTNQ
jgi:hypothetical protein